MLVDLQLAKDLYFAFSRTVPGQFSVSVIADFNSYARCGVEDQFEAREGD